ncbi:hypothetical protein EJB05_29577, partial [Eragrostis curvula]
MGQDQILPKIKVRIRTSLLWWYPASVDAIADLPERSAKEGECGVCLEDFEGANVLGMMPCAHSFHEECIFKWLRRSHVCPLCLFPLRCPRKRNSTHVLLLTNLADYSNGFKHNLRHASTEYNLKARHELVLYVSGKDPRANWLQPIHLLTPEFGKVRYHMTAERKLKEYLERDSPRWMESDGSGLIWLRI